jgi:hypothetical protein
MSALISLEEFKEKIIGFTVVDCAVRNKDFLYFMAVNTKEAEKAGVLSEQTVTKRIVVFRPGKPDGARVARSQFTGWSSTVIAGSQYGEDKIVGVDSGGKVYAAGGGKVEDEDQIPLGPGGPRQGAIFRARMINGMLYASGAWYTLCRRRGRNDWESLCMDLPKQAPAKYDPELASDMTFDDVDGFAHDDIYTVGGHGVVWHYDGKEWRQIPFPSNMILESICCAGDGHVYIGAQSGTLFRGRGNKWEMVERGNMTLPFKDIVWHAGRLWCTSDYGLWTLEDNHIVRADVPSEISVCAGNLSVADGVMLMAGANGAAFHDGESWQSIYLYQQMLKEI